MDIEGNPLPQTLQKQVCTYASSNKLGLQTITSILQTKHTEYNY